MPLESYTIRTGDARPVMAIVPVVCGTIGGGGAGLVRHAATRVTPRSARLRRMAIKEGLLAEYDHETATTRKLLERVPEDRLAWKPHARSMSFGQLAMHLSSIPRWGDAILNAEVLSAFDRHVRTTRAALDKSDAELAALWTLKRDGQEIFAMPRAAAFRSFVLYHLVHHRGQMSVYLRLNGIPVPSIYGPSADEG
jgi:uncharacterized damage-inducible protein DinB